MPSEKITRYIPSFNITVTTPSPLNARTAWNVGLAYAPDTKQGREARAIIQQHYGEHGKSQVVLLGYMRGYYAKKKL